MREEDLAKEFGNLVRRLRYERGLSQAGFAEAAKVDRAHMGEIERGEVTVTIVTALKIAQALGNEPRRAVRGARGGRASAPVGSAAQLASGDLARVV